MKKRIASLFMAIVMTAALGIGAVAVDQPLVQGNTTGLTAANFKDLADSTKPDGRHWAWASIDDVVKAGLFNGTSPTTFAPQNPMTRAQFVVVITRLENTTRTARDKLNVERVPTETRFTDVPTDMWCAGAVAWAEANGIVEGYSDNTFRPNQAISRAQIAAFVYRYCNNYKKYNLKNLTPTPQQFTDFALASTVFSSAIDYCRTKGLILGFSDHTLRPNISVTRAQVAAILSRIIIVINNRGGGGGGGGGGGTQTAGVKLTTTQNVGGTVTVERFDATTGNWVLLANQTFDVTDLNVTGAVTNDASVRYRVTATADTANGYELKTFSVTEDTTNEIATAGTVAIGSRVAIVSLTEGDTTVTPVEPAVLIFDVYAGGLADVDVSFKQYQGYLLTGSVNMGSRANHTQTFSVSKRTFTDSLVSSLYLMNNDIWDATLNNNAGAVRDANASSLVGADAAGGIAQALLDDITGGLDIEVQGSVLNRLLQESIEKTLKDKEATLVNQVTGLANSATPSADWVSKLEDQITNALKTEVQNAGGTWQNDWRAVINPADVTRVTFKPTDDSYEALTSTVLADIRSKLDSGAFSINAATHTETVTTNNTPSYRFTVVGEISGGPITLSAINQNITIQMLFDDDNNANTPAVTTGAGPRYTVRTNNGTGAAVADVKHPVTGNTIFTFSGTVAMNSLNSAAASNPINIQYTPDPIQASDIPSTPVAVENFLTVSTIDNKFNSVVNRLDGETTAINRLYDIYNPNSRTSGYVKVATVTKSGDTSANPVQIIDTITLGSDVLLSTEYVQANNTMPATGPDNTIVITPYLPHWQGASATAANPTPNVATRNPNATDLFDANIHFDELASRVNAVRNAISGEAYFLGSLNNHPSLYSITATMESDATTAAPTNAELKQALAKTLDKENPTCADLFRALGTKAAGVKSITVTANKTFNTNGQIGGAMNTAIGTNQVGGSFTIERFATIDEAVRTS